jgi:hypothetical protein
MSGKAVLTLWRLKPVNVWRIFAAWPASKITGESNDLGR